MIPTINNSLPVLENIISECFEIIIHKNQFLNFIITSIILTIKIWVNYISFNNTQSLLFGILLILFPTRIVINEHPKYNSTFRDFSPLLLIYQHFVRIYHNISCVNKLRSHFKNIRVFYNHFHTNMPLLLHDLLNDQDNLFCHYIRSYR